MSGLLVLERYKVVTNSWFLGGNGLQQANLSYGLLTLDFIDVDRTSGTIKIDTSKIKELEEIYKYTSLESVDFDESGVNLNILLL